MTQYFKKHGRVTSALICALLASCGEVHRAEFNYSDCVISNQVTNECDRSGEANKAGQ